VQAINPAIVYCAISGYGQTGPGAGRPAYAPVIHAATGFDRAHLFYQQGRERPDNCGIFVADYASGAYALGGILAALHQRHVTGKGQMVDVSMFEALVGMLLGEVNRAQFDFEMPSRPMYGPVEAKDGYVMLATASERTFQDMATAAGRRDWLTDPRFEKYADRRMNWDQFVDEFEAWSKTLTVEECVAALDKHGVPCSPYYTVTEALQDPQVAHRGTLCTIEDSAGSYKSPAPPFRFSGSALQSGPNVSSLGEHTREILEQAGLSAAEIAALAK
jgi:crotonobetainyl-CoA:carnitine CoA-transferase CaiB-like acyl-CoA transferase